MKLPQAKTIGYLLLAGLLLAGEAGYLRTWHEGRFCTRCHASGKTFTLLCGPIPLWRWRSSRGTRISEAYQRLRGPCHPHAFARGHAGGSSGFFFRTKSNGGSGETDRHFGRKQVVLALLLAEEGPVPSPDLARETWTLLDRLCPPEAGREVLEEQKPELTKLAESLHLVRNEEDWRRVLEEYAP